MATSGVVTLDFDIAEIVEEAWERAGGDVQQLNAGHARSLRRSLNLIFAEWENLNVRIWGLVQASETLTEGDTDFNLPAGTVDVVDAVLRRGGIDTPMARIDRQDYLAIPDKDIEGRPDRYWVDRSAVPAKMYVYATSDNSTDAIVYWRIRRLYDVTAGQETADVPRRWLPALIAALAWEAYGKMPKEARDPAIRDDLKDRKTTTFTDARREDRDRADVFVGPDMSMYEVP